MIVHRADLYDEFIAGIRDGLKSALSLLPLLIALVTAVTVFNASGAADALARIVAPIMQKLGVPEEIVPMLIVRPVSGAASSAVFDTLLSDYGADSFVGRCASVIAGTSDTVVYITALYFGSVGVKRYGRVLLVAGGVGLFGVFASCLCVRLWFG